jgi:hypothetical protein
MTKPRTVQTAIHGGEISLCGVQPKITETDFHAERVDVHQKHHPGFGNVTLRRNGLEIWSTVFDKEDKSLVEIENEFIQDDKGQWTFKVDGPKTGYLLTRRRRNFWTVTATDLEFA